MSKHYRGPKLVTRATTRAPLWWVLYCGFVPDPRVYPTASRHTCA